MNVSGGNPTVVFNRPRVVTLEERPLPVVGRGELLVRMGHSLLSTGTELTILSGDFEPGSMWAGYAKYPFLAGYSGVGEVVEVGHDVDDDWLGRRVCVPVPHALLNAVDAGAARPVPAGVSNEQAAFFTLAETVMNGVRRAGVGWGDAVVVYGAGLLGQLAARFCRLCGARPVFVVDIIPGRLALLPSDPAIVSLDAQKDDVLETIRERTRGRLADLVFEVTGNAKLITQEFAVLRRQGRFIVLSSPAGKPAPFDFHDFCNWPSVTIVGTHISSHPPVETPGDRWTRLRNSELFLDLLHDRELDLEPLISHRLPYTEAPALYSELLTDRAPAMGVVFEWTT
jgi:2-desacetyl-2-hydroxyethyl bacteriochlorophyllide A dehydrogenase